MTLWTWKCRVHMTQRLCAWYFTFDIVMHIHTYLSNQYEVLIHEKTPEDSHTWNLQVILARRMQDTCLYIICLLSTFLSIFFSLLISPCFDILAFYWVNVCTPMRIITIHMQPCTWCEWHSWASSNAQPDHTLAHRTPVSASWDNDDCRWWWQRWYMTWESTC